MLRKRKWFILIIVCLAIVAFVFFSRNTAIPVKRIEIADRFVRKTVTTSGEVKSDKFAQLSFAATGRISQIYVKEGDSVTQGAILAVLDSFSDYQTAQSLKDTRDSALRDLEYFMLQKSENLDLYDTSEGFDLQKRKLEEAVSKSEAAYQAQLGSISKLYIYAPFDGVILNISQKVGETISVGTPLIKIGNTNDLYFEVTLDQEDFGFVELNQSVIVNLDSYPTLDFAGFVSSTPLYANGTDGSDFTIKIKFSEVNSKLLLGMTGDAYIILEETKTSVPSITFDEIFYDVDEKPYLLVSKNDLVEKEYINLGIEGDVFVELKNKPENVPIKSGVDKVDLKEGMKVKLIN